MPRRRGSSGNNTDAPGFGRFLERDAGFRCGGHERTRVRRRGAGSGVRAGDRPRGAARIVVALREPVRASALIATLDGLETTVEVVTSRRPHGRGRTHRERHPLGAHGEALRCRRSGPRSSPSICSTDPRARRCKATSAMRVGCVRRSGSPAASGGALDPNCGPDSRRRWRRCPRRPSGRSAPGPDATDSPSLPRVVFARPPQGGLRPRRCLPQTTHG